MQCSMDAASIFVGERTIGVFQVANEPSSMPGYMLVLAIERPLWCFPKDIFNE